MSIIDSIKDKIGNIIYPKTVTKAVYDDVTGDRLDNILDSKIDVSSFTWDGIPDKPSTFVANGIEGSDTRSVDYSPSDYMSTGSMYVGKAGSVTEFKYSSTLGVTGFVGTYVFLETKNPWSDGSGGYPIQIVYGNGKPQWRVGITVSTWSAWSSF